MCEEMHSMRITKSAVAKKSPVPVGKSALSCPGAEGGFGVIWRRHNCRWRTKSCRVLLVLFLRRRLPARSLKG